VAAFRAVARFIGRNAKRLGVTIAGFLLILVGLIMLITPGPGWAAIFAGLGVLATEYVWARRALDAAKDRARRATRRITRRRVPRRRGGPAGGLHPAHEVRPALSDPPPAGQGEASETG
jgi:uncharacterized protein (TIGR02611 family)